MLALDLPAATRIVCPMPRSVLVVDDDPHIRQLLVFALGKAGFDTAEAADGEAALAAVAADRPDLVVLDINMPRMDGLEVCRRLRGSGGDTPVLFLSSRDDEIDRVVGIELGADDYVCKPFSPREVVARVQAVLRRTGARAPAITAPAIRHGALTLDLDGWRAEWAGAAIRADADRILDPANARRPPRQGIQPRRDHRPPPRSRLRDHRPHDRQPHPQPAREIRRRRRRRPDRDAGRDRLSAGRMHLVMLNPLRHPCAMPHNGRSAVDEAYRLDAETRSA